MKKEIIFLQEELKKKKVQAVLIFTGDYHQSEYTNDHFKVRQFFSGFNGSFGVLLVSLKEALLWTDSRYFLRAEFELKDSGITLCKMGTETPLWDEYIVNEFAKGDIVIVDEGCTSFSTFNNLKQKLSKKNIELIGDDFAFVNSMWDKRPKLEFQKIYELDEQECGKKRTQKINDIKKELEKLSTSSVLLSSLDDVAWTMNLRGSDIEFNPFFFSYLYVPKKGNSVLFADLAAVDSTLKEELLKQKIEVKTYFSIFEFLNEIKNDTVYLDERVSLKIANYFEKDFVCMGKSPVLTMKSLKNKKEIDNIQKVMVKDGVALINAFMKIENTVAENKPLNEYQVDSILFESRNKASGFVSPSFASIVGFRENGAIVHYKAESNKCKSIEKEGVLLVDSGGQYLYGTTDITRTIYLGENPKEDEISTYTRVLDGHVSLSMATFPEAAPSSSLDGLAKNPLWKAGLSYGHGTGHGVGFLLGVHEGPCGISPISSRLYEGNVLSNEPGCYFEGKFGVRIENLMVVKKSKKFANFFKFDTLTLFPYERKLINKKLLSREKINFINAYHKRCYKVLSSFLNEEQKKWLENKTQKL